MKRILLLALILAMAILPALGKAQNEEEYVPMYTLTEKYGFKFGASFSFNHLKDQKYLDFVKTHFNSITATNEMKAYSLLNQTMCKLAKDGMPQMNYYYADKMVQWAQDNGLKVRGHVLVWDAYMTDWFFREGYEINGKYADQETMRARLESYIRQVITHFEEKFPGTVYCWDVVNEAVGDNANEYVAGDPRHLRTIRSGVDNLFRTYVGDDYVEFSFLCARNTVDELGADIGLFYNDYNNFYADKRTAIIALLNSINTYAKDENGEYRKLCDSVGMQGYIGGYGVQQGCMNEGDLTRIRETIQIYADMGLNVHVTEMAVRNFEKSQADKHAAFYGKLMKVFTSFAEDGKSPLSCVAIWGLTDNPNDPKNDYTYRMNGSFGGLITENYEIKPAFDTVQRTLKGE